MPGQSQRKKIPILMYHSVSDQTTPQYRPYVVSTSLFARQMEYLRQQNYTPLTVTDFIERRSRDERTLPDRPVVLTFDDGLGDFYTGALPTLQRYGFPATLYVITGLVNGTSTWLEKEGEGHRPMLTWQQLAEVQAAGVECGGHTHTHVQLDTLPLHEAREEITQCKKILEDRLGRAVYSFSYPHGYHTRAIKRFVQEAGYTSACTVAYEMCAENTEPFALKRLLVGPDTDLADLEALLATDYLPPLVSMYKHARIPLWRMVRRARAGRAHQQREKMALPAEVM